MESPSSFFSSERLQRLGGSFIKAHLRFPLTILFSFAVSLILVFAISSDDPEFFDRRAKDLHTCALAVPLLFALEMFSERKWWSRWLLYSGGAAILILYYLLVKYPEKQADSEDYFARLILLALIFHLSVAFLPYIKTKSEESFWQYNKGLFLAILTAILYSGTLFAGLGLAILGIDKLFEVRIHDDAYGYLGVILAFYVNTVLFCGNAPLLSTCDKQTDYPKGLKLFTQFVLLPLVAIYLLILLSYETKILLSWSLPKGWVSYLVLASGFFGILAFLLIYPLKGAVIWIRRYNRGFYWLLVPLILLMMVAIYVRINQYGITSRRYIVALLACWLLGISVYFIASKKDRIRRIPISLAAVLLLSVGGPLGFDQVARRNQQSRLVNVLTRNDLMKQGKIAPDTGKKLDTKDADQLSASLDYLSRKHWDWLQKMIPQKKVKDISDTYPAQRKDKLWELMGLKNPPGGQMTRHGISVMRKMEKVSRGLKEDFRIQVAPFGRNWKEEIEAEGHVFRISRNSDTRLLIGLDKEEMIFSFENVLLLDGEADSQKMTFYAESESWKGIFVLNSFFKYENGEVANCEGILLLFMKPGQTF